MKEQLFIETVKSIIGDKYIGDDCAYLEDLGIVVSQDSLVEDVHFKTEYMTPYKLGFKSMMVNLSDISASGAEPKYVSIALSLPKNIENDFIKEFYKGAKDALCDVEIVGGDITGSEKIVVSVCIIGKVGTRKISSRANAKSGQVVITTGVHGSSAGGLELLLQGKREPKSMIDAHLMPKAQLDVSKIIAQNIKEDYAMMDTSDGLADALYKIAKASNKKLIIEFEKIKFDEELKTIFSQNYKEKMLFGGEDYQIVATVPKDILPNLKDVYVIGEVVELEQNETPVVELKTEKEVLKINSLEKCYNHFNL